MEKEVFSVDEVREVLDDYVLLKLDPKGVAKDKTVADRFQVTMFPTIVIVDAQGEEIDRIVGFRRAPQFVEDLWKIRRGDTFSRLTENIDWAGADHRLLDYVVKGYERRDDYNAVIQSIHAFHPYGIPECCKKKLWNSKMTLLNEMYWDAGKVMKGAPNIEIVLPEEAPVPRLRRLLEQCDGNLKDCPDGARRLSDARRLDARLLIKKAMCSLCVDDEVRLEIAEQAQRNGCYDLALKLYRQAFYNNGEGKETYELRNAALAVYAAGIDRDLGVRWAREAHRRDLARGGGGPVVAMILADAGYTDEAVDVIDLWTRKDLKYFRMDGVDRDLRFRRRIAAGEVRVSPPDFEAWPMGIDL